MLKPNMQHDLTQPMDNGNISLHINKNKYLFGLSFIVGMFIMCMEVAADRLLTPYFGSSLYVSTGLTSALMLYLAIGYYIGGTIAGKYASEKTLYKILLGISIYTSLASWWAPSYVFSMAAWTNLYPLSLFLMAGMSTLLPIGIPFILIGMLIPYIIHLTTYTSTNGFLVKNIGKIIAYITWGSIIGTLVPTFLILPFLGTKKTVLYAGILLALVAIIGLARVGKKNVYPIN